MHAIPHSKYGEKRRGRTEERSAARVLKEEREEAKVLGVKFFSASRFVILGAGCVCGEHWHWLGIAAPS